MCHQSRYNLHVTSNMIRKLWFITALQIFEHAKEQPTVFVTCGYALAFIFTNVQEDKQSS